MRRHTGSRISLWTWAVLIGGALAVLASPSWADSRGHGHGKRHDAAHFIKHVLTAGDELGLTEEQETRLRAVKTAFKKERITKKAAVDLAKVDLRDLLHSDQASMSEIEAMVNKMYALKAELRVASIKAAREAKAVLTPDQRKKLKALHRHHGEGSRSGDHAYRHHHDEEGERH